MRINNYTPDTKVFEKMSLNNKDNVKSSSFTDLLKQKLDEVNETQISAEETTTNFIKGKEKNIHNVMLSTTEAKMSLDTAIEVRNKIVEAYQELNRIQI